jgi:spore coat protein U-like protein
MDPRRVVPAILVALALLSPAAARAASVQLQVNAVVLSKNVCKFSTASANLPFGVLDPGAGIDRMATGTVGLRCIGSAPIATFILTDDGGLYDAVPGARRMLRATAPAAYLPYSIRYTPQSATIPKNTLQTITIDGTVLASDIANAVPGAYADTVTLTVLP